MGLKVWVEGSSGFRAMDVCLRRFGFRLWAEGPLGFRCGDVSVAGFRLVLQALGLEKLRVQWFGCRFCRFGLGAGEFQA